MHNSSVNLCGTNHAFIMKSKAYLGTGRWIWKKNIREPWFQIPNVCIHWLKLLIRWYFFALTVLIIHLTPIFFHCMNMFHCIFCQQNDNMFHLINSLIVFGCVLQIRNYFEFQFTTKSPELGSATLKCSDRYRYML